MVNLDKSGIKTGTDITAAHITALYDALTGTTVYDNVYSNKGKIYRGFITQSGTNAPTVIELENTLGVTPVLGYLVEGNYYIRVDNACFTSNKTFFRLSGGNTIFLYRLMKLAVDQIEWKTTNIAGDAVNNVLNHTTLEIIVYP